MMPELRNSPLTQLRRYRSRVSVTTSSGVKRARGTSLERRFTQYWQSYRQKLVSRIFSSDTQRPSGVKLWQMPGPLAPRPEVPFELRFGAPLLAQDTSYLAASARMLSLSMGSTSRVPNTVYKNSNRDCRPWPAPPPGGPLGCRLAEQMRLQGVVVAGSVSLAGYCTNKQCQTDNRSAPT